MSLFLGGTQRGNNTKLPSLRVLPPLSSKQKYSPFPKKKPYSRINHRDGRGDREINHRDGRGDRDGTLPIVTLAGPSQQGGEGFKDSCIIKKWIDEGLIQDRYKCYLTDFLCFCDTTIGCYWRQ